MECIVELTSPNFIEIKDGSDTCYGGTQAWWLGRNTRMKKYGCGAISLSDTELYITNNKSIDCGSYISYVDVRFKKLYHFLIARGVPFWKMSFGFWRALRANSIKSLVWWAPSLRKKKLLSHIETMLSNDMPVPASYFVFLKKNGLPLYKYNGSIDDFVYSQDIHSHYFTITGIYRSEKTGKKYLKISSWGKCFYAELDAWLKKSSVFSNILYYKIKSN